MVSVQVALHERGIIFIEKRDHIVISELQTKALYQILKPLFIPCKSTICLEHFKAKTPPKDLLGLSKLVSTLSLFTNDFEHARFLKRKCSQNVVKYFQTSRSKS